MELFQKLGVDIENKWRELHYNEDGFSKIAADALREAKLSSTISAWDVIEWTLAQPELPQQKDLRANFGNPPITVFNGPRFHIDVYFWLDGTTQIHQHSFCGAFEVLLGSSLHSWYGFERDEVINSYMETGRLRLNACDLLKVGDVKEINAGRDYIHALFHLDQPSVTIVVRTEQSPHFLPQFSYHKPHIALDPFFEHETTTKKLQSLNPLFQTNHPETDRLVSDILEHADFHTSFSVLSTVHSHLSGSFFGQLFNLDAPAIRFKSFVDIVTRRHGSKGAKLGEVFEYQNRLNEIVRRRSYITDAEQRYFFALLLNVEGRETIFSLVKARFPDADPIEKILDWVHDLSQTRVAGVNKSNALGIENFDDIDLSILEGLLRTIPDSVLRDRITDEYGPGKVDSSGFDQKLERIRGSVIFAPLFSEEV